MSDQLTRGALERASRESVSSDAAERDTRVPNNDVAALMRALADGRIQTRAKVSSRGVSVTYFGAGEEVTQEAIIARDSEVQKMSPEVVQRLEVALCEKLVKIITEEYERESAEPFRDRLFSRVKSLTASMSASEREASRKADTFVEQCMKVVDRKRMDSADIRVMVYDISSGKQMSG